MEEQKKYYDDPYSIRAGQPPKYKTPEELQDKCDEYFEYIKGDYVEHRKVLKDEKGMPLYNDDGILVYDTWRECLREPERPMVTALTLYLGFPSRQSLFDYQDRPPRGNQKYSDIVKRARMRVEMNYEKMLGTTAPTGAIFALKNMHWKDVQEVNNNLSGQVTFKFEQDEKNDALPE